ncbi:hypothetical protein NQ318_017900 [Aromia moschata]|uniref:Fibronectin type-III domain-containing protein n=1 Tax=Aromia moschata TaxID=1265417 RepID=A0AAV8YAU6_9CUCU|nr:hypothetical protein NQ318_017900 [Aromia moschata]
MTSSFRTVFVLALFICAIHQSKQEPCEPGMITNLTLNDNYILTWQTPADEKCEIQSYLVYISTVNGTVHYTYNVALPRLSIHTLPVCQGYTFRVHQVSTDSVTGLGWSLYMITPPPSDASLALDYLTLTEEDRDIRLQWSLEDQWVACARRYRVLIYNEDADEITDLYTISNTLLINNLVPCAHYTLGVTAIFTLIEEGPTTTVEHTVVDAVTAAPGVAGVRPEGTRVNFNWTLDAYNSNRCPIYSLVIDGSPYFNVSYDIQDQENRTPLPLTITGLSPNSLYILRVNTINSAGSSPPLQMAIQTSASD